MAGVGDFETGRLGFLRSGMGDFDESAAMWGDPATTAFIGGVGISAADAWGRKLRNAGHWSLFRYGFWTVRERVGGAFVGEVGFK